MRVRVTGLAGNPSSSNVWQLFAGAGSGAVKKMELPGEKEGNKSKDSLNYPSFSLPTRWSLTGIIPLIRLARATENAGEGRMGLVQGGEEIPFLTGGGR